MTAAYIADEKNVVHLIAPGEGGTFTFCNRATDGDGVEFEPDDTFTGPAHSGPATCWNCREAFDEAREAMKGARWRLKS